jgi:prophage tail gpP-like protein
MPNPASVATVTIDGQSFTFWENIIVERSVQEAISSATLIISEPGPLNAGFQGLKIGPGQKADVSLAGQLAISQGIVDLRQVFFDKASHGVQVRVTSRTQNILSSTVASKPGQYLNSGISQISNAVCNPLGITCQIIGNPPGADKAFERVSETPGQPAFDFIESLARMRHLFIVDDAQGNLNFVRGGSGTPLGSADPLVLGPGGNILSGRVILEYNPLIKSVTAQGQNFGNDDHWGQQASDVSATVQGPVALGGLMAQRRSIVVMELAGDSTDAKMRAEHEISAMLLTTFEAVITVPGWLMSNGQLWLSLIGGSPCPVTLNAPLIFPSNATTIPQLYLKAVKHMQDDKEGTRTELTLCLQQGLGGPEIVGDPLAPAP